MGKGGMRYKVTDILTKLEQEGKCRVLSIEESEVIANKINKEMRKVSREYILKEAASVEIARKIIINT